MNVTEPRTLDMAQLLLQAYEVGDMINSSAEVADYLYWKQVMERDPAVQEAVRRFAKTKERFEDCQRFGHFHPDYHAAMEEMKRAQAELDRIEAVARFKQAEERLDDLLYTISETIAHSVSESIKVPSNNPLPTKGCGSGGCGSCG